MGSHWDECFGLGAWGCRIKIRKCRKALAIRMSLSLLLALGHCRKRDGGNNIWTGTHMASGLGANS